MPSDRSSPLPARGRSYRPRRRSVSFRIDEAGGEYWERRFARRRYAGQMRAGRGIDTGLLVERFRPFTLLHRPTARPDGLAWRIIGLRLFGIPLPRWTVPRVDCL